MNDRKSSWQQVAEGKRRRTSRARRFERVEGVVRFELTFGGEGVVEGGEKTGERAKRKKEGEHGAELEHRELIERFGENW